MRTHPVFVPFTLGLEGDQGYSATALAMWGLARGGCLDDLCNLLLPHGLPLRHSRVVGTQLVELESADLL